MLHICHPVSPLPPGYGQRAESHHGSKFLDHRKTRMPPVPSSQFGPDFIIQFDWVTEIFSRIDDQHRVRTKGVIESV